MQRFQGYRSDLPRGELPINRIHISRCSLRRITRSAECIDVGHQSWWVDRERIQKSLFTSHPKSTAVTLKTFSTPIIESSFIATEIKRMIAYSGGVLGYDDFAILRKLDCLHLEQGWSTVRYNALSRTIESTLQKDSIPNKIVGGHKFFERLEVKDLLAYLQLAENPGFNVS